MPTVLMFARIGSRHFAHLYISGLLRLRLGLVRRLDLPLEGRRHDRAVGPSREHVPATAACPYTGRRSPHGDRGAPPSEGTLIHGLIDLLNPAANEHAIPWPE